MKVREENRNIVLLAAVTLVCAFIALVAAAFDPAPSTAQTAGKLAALADQAPVRIVGVPFQPNTHPSEHQ
jgi:acid phosphatase class B